MTKNSNKFSLHIGSDISLKDFLFSQLITAVKYLFNTEGLDRYSRKSREFEKSSLETITDQSFRRSAKSINEMSC